MSLFIFCFVTPSSSVSRLFCLLLGLTLGTDSLPVSLIPSDIFYHKHFNCIVIISLFLCRTEKELDVLLAEGIRTLSLLLCERESIQKGVMRHTGKRHVQ